MTKEILSTIIGILNEIYFLDTDFEDFETLKVLFTKLELLLEKEEKSHET